MPEDRVISHDHATQLIYMQRDIEAIRGTIDKWIGKNDEQMAALARSISEKEGLYDSRFVRNDVLKLEFANITASLSNIQQLLNTQVASLTEVREYLPMLKTIKEERADIKHTLMQWASKIIFFIFSVGVAALALKK